MGFYDARLGLESGTRGLTWNQACSSPSVVEVSLEPGFMGIGLMLQ